MPAPFAALGSCSPSLASNETKSVVLIFLLCLSTKSFLHTDVWFYRTFNYILYIFIFSNVTVNNAISPLVFAFDTVVFLLTVARTFQQTRESRMAGIKRGISSIMLRDGMVHIQLSSCQSWVCARFPIFLVCHCPTIDSRLLRSDAHRAIELFVVALIVTQQVSFYLTPHA